MNHYFILAGLVFGINLLPAFAPPTWVVLVFYKLNTELDSFAIVAIGVSSSAAGRYILALVTRAIRTKLKPEYVKNLEHLESRIGRGKKSLVLYFLFFAIAPIPSAQLFEAAALMGTPLLPITGAFMIGRAISYSTYVIGASTVKSHAMGTALVDSLKSPWGISIQILCIIALYLLVKIDWSKHLAKKRQDAGLESSEEKK
jgi:membrane protein YqaA with SNARE-associated domain